MTNSKLLNIIVPIIALLTNQACVNSLSNNWGDRYSINISQSKEIGVYICEYTSKCLLINDSIKISITNIIAEKQHGIYSHDTDTPYTIDSTKSQIVLAIEPSWGELWEKYGYSNTWKFSNMYSVRENTWVIDIYSPIPPDTVYIDVINDEADSTGRAGIHYGEKIGEFYIVKKIDKL